jgi:GT2 family glycosyltransferase
MPKSDATIIVPQHNRPELTIACVQSLRAHERADWPVIVVDDGSCGDALNRTRAALSDAVILSQPHRGVTAAWNLGVRSVSTPFVVLLNNDVVATGPWVRQLLRPLLREEALLSGIELREERAVSPRVLSALGLRQFLAGWCFAFSARVFDAVGGFDERLRLYFSDTDFQARVIRDCGQENNRLIFQTGLPLRHAAHRSTRDLSDRHAIWLRDRAQFIGKWTGRRA